MGKKETQRGNLKTCDCDLPVGEKSWILKQHACVNRPCTRYRMTFKTNYADTPVSVELRRLRTIIIYFILEFEGSTQLCVLSWISPMLFVFSVSILWKTVGYAVWNCRSYCNCNCRCEVLCVHCLSHFCTLILRFDLDGTSCQRSGKGNSKKTVLGVDDDHDLNFEFFFPISFFVVSGRGCCAIRYPLNL